MMKSKFNILKLGARVKKCSKCLSLNQVFKAGDCLRTEIDTIQTAICQYRQRLSYIDFWRTFQQNECNHFRNSSMKAHHLTISCIIFIRSSSFLICSNILGIWEYHIRHFKSVKDILLGTWSLSLSNFYAKFYFRSIYKIFSMTTLWNRALCLIFVK